ncbi:hypothetical protein Tco_0435299 [Tanacetum coccineum]
MSGSPKRTSVFSRIRRDRSESPRHRPVGKGRRDGGVFNRLGGKEKSVSAHSESRYQSSRSGRTESVPRKRHYEGTCSRRTKMFFENPFTPRIRYFDFPKKTRMPNNVKTYDGSDDPEDHLKIFQAAAKVERWAILTWCHMFNFTLTGSARKCIKDSVEIHHIKQRDGESTEDFVQRFKVESRHVNGASECMRISGFMNEITNPELIKRLHDNIPKLVDEMMRVTTAFLKGEVAASNHNQQRSERRSDMFTLLTKSPKEILALDKGKFKTLPLMTTPVEKRNNNKFSERISQKAAEKGETSRKDKPLAILMVQLWQRVARERITQSFSPNPEISFPPLGDKE